MTVFGWDASDFDWQRGPMDLAAAARDGITFFTHKATEGTRTVHVHYRDALARARNAGIPYLGAYMVPRTPGNGGHGSIGAQVSYFLDYVNSQTPWWRDVEGFFFQIDLEHWSYDAVGPTQGLAAAAAVRAQTGRQVLLYAPQWAYGNSLTGRDPLWASSYGSNPTGHYREAYPGDASARWAVYSGRAPAILQYGSRLTVGSQPVCDVNAFRGSIADLHRLITGKDLPIMASDQLLNGWTPPVLEDGKPDTRGVGIWAADAHNYVWSGRGCYETAPGNPAGPASGMYLDRLLKLIRDDVKANGGKLDDLATRPAAALTEAQVAAIMTAVQTALADTVRSAVKEELAALTLRAS